MSSCLLSNGFPSLSCSIFSILSLSFSLPGSNLRSECNVLSEKVYSQTCVTHGSTNRIKPERIMSSNVCVLRVLYESVHRRGICNPQDRNSTWLMYNESNLLGKTETKVCQLIQSEERKMDGKMPKKKNKTFLYLMGNFFGTQSLLKEVTISNEFDDFRGFRNYLEKSRDVLVFQKCMILFCYLLIVCFWWVNI